MRKPIINIAIVLLVCFIGLAGCGTRKAASAQDAINKSKSIKTAQAKKDYLMKQSQAFFNDKDFKTSIDIAQYVLRKVDPEAKEPTTLIRKAEDALVVQKQIEARKAKKSASI